MSGALRSPLTTGLLLALCVALGYRVQDTLDSAGSVADARGKGAAQATAPAPERRRVERIEPLPAIETMTETVERPLFSETRRPPTEEIEEVEEGPPPELNVMLSGIVITDGQKLAHIQSNDDPRVRVLSEGDAVDRWRIESILPDRVVLKSGDRTEQLLLKDAERAPPPSARERRPRRPNVVRRNARERAEQRRRDRQDEQRD